MLDNTFGVSINLAGHLNSRTKTFLHDSIFYGELPDHLDCNHMNFISGARFTGDCTDSANVNHFSCKK
jgi:hypothetical protein